ncbi:hypothetical protein DOTSEDRAFT_39333 [Dothistroma septosporum NZE10]|uniref:F-box domain-containing protein n=1 Tax=Dothistroma septosporum (strain NZE10 / CBS 128990) TaxID=675120 RepID=N1PBN3_DOTSN|nr:hypothetical protein DOTSEDRAFT_39333 [Dothistroma septosporum NZE10]
MSTQEHIALSNKPFRFFDLPRELRDVVYNLLPRSCRDVYETATTEQHSDTKYGLRLELIDRPLGRFRLINKQFEDEYSQRAVKHGSLHIEDLREGPIIRTALPAEVLHAKHIVFKLAALPEDHEDEARNQVIFVKDVLGQWPKAPTIYVQLYFGFWGEGGEDWSASGDSKKLKSLLREFEELEGLEKIELSVYEEGGKTPGESVGELDGTLLASYTNDGGWLTRST